MAATAAFCEALNKGITSGILADTKIIVFSRKNTGTVCRSKALYASSHVLKSVPYFDDREPLITQSQVHSTNNPVVLFYKFSSGNLQRQNLGISIAISLTMNSRIMATTPTAISRTMKTRRSLDQSPQSNSTHRETRSLATQITTSWPTKEKSSGYLMWPSSRTAHVDRSLDDF